MNPLLLLLPHSYSHPCPNARHPMTLLRLILAIILASSLSIMTWLAFNPTQQVPNVSFTLLSGQKISTRQLTGKVYLVHFWATSCSTCMQEMPQMVKMYSKFNQQGLEFIAVAMDYDPPMYVTHYSRTRQLPFKVAIDDGNAAKSFGNVQLTPTTFIINKNGRILKRYLGLPKFDELEELLRSALVRPG